MFILKLFLVRLLPLIRWVIREHIAGIRCPILPKGHPDLAPPTGRQGARAVSGGSVGSGVGGGHHTILEIGARPKMTPPRCPIASLVILNLQSTKNLSNFGLF